MSNFIDASPWIKAQDKVATKHESWRTHERLAPKTYRAKLSWRGRGTRCYCRRMRHDRIRSFFYRFALDRKRIVDCKDLRFWPRGRRRVALSSRPNGGIGGSEPT